VPEPYRSPDWALVPAKPAQGLNTNNNNINKMHGSRSKIPSKKSHQAALAKGFNSGVKGLIYCPTMI
jgi:hypothetical protein